MRHIFGEILLPAAAPRTFAHSIHIEIHDVSVEDAPSVRLAVTRMRDVPIGPEARIPFVITAPEADPSRTVVIRAEKLAIENGLQGQPSIKVTADAETWLGFLAGERNLLWALLTRRIRLKGNPKWLLLFKRCFPT